ncbi:hypothetical protein RQP46_007237 [Phenoliferia psychrophenolica]
MISFRSALVVAAAIRTLGATPIPNMNQENVVEDSGVWTRLLDASCQSNSTCAAELVPLRACSTTYYAKLDAGTAVVADLFTAEKCICSLPVPVCIACATSVQAANPTVNQENYTIFADSYGGVVEICAADGYAAAGGQIVPSSTKAASAGRNGVCGLAVGVLALLVVLF